MEGGLASGSRSRSKRTLSAAARSLRHGTHSGGRRCSVLSETPPPSQSAGTQSSSSWNPMSSCYHVRTKAEGSVLSKRTHAWARRVDTSRLFVLTTQLTPVSLAPRCLLCAEQGVGARPAGSEAPHRPECVHDVLGGATQPLPFNPRLLQGFRVSEAVQQI